MDRAAGATSQFATSLIDLLDRVHYRRVSVEEQFDPVYKLRYEAYRREDFIPINSQQITRDKFDDAPNCHCLMPDNDLRIPRERQVEKFGICELFSVN